MNILFVYFYNRILQRCVKRSLGTGGGKHFKNL